MEIDSNEISIIQKHELYIYQPLFICSMYDFSSFGEFPAEAKEQDPTAFKAVEIRRSVFLFVNEEREKEGDEKLWDSLLPREKQT